MLEPKLVVGLQVYNEEENFLSEWVKDVETYADALVALDDCSTDRTVEMLFEGFRGKPMEVARAPRNLFRENELLLRKWLWSLLKLQCERFLDQGYKPWILMLDADEFLEDKLKRDMGSLLRAEDIWYYNLTFYHFWRSRQHYRVDKLWAPPKGPRLIRYDPECSERWRETPLHCGSTPLNIFKKQGASPDYVIKHYGYVKSPEEKYQRYMELDPDGRYVGNIDHYHSMLDEDPVLVEWSERT